MKEEWRAEFEGKKILIWGFGREGISSYRLIRSVCPDLVIDIADSEKVLEKAEKETVRTRRIPQATADFASYDLILKSPGIVLPDGMSTKNITGETQLFLKHYGSQVIGITGTKGKSTTTSLVAHVLKERYRVHLVGNIGIPCFDIVETLQPEDLVAFEISCHQLEYCPYSPHVAVFLNLFEEHLDHYGSFEKYGAAKANIFLHQRDEDITILNQDLKQWIPFANHPILIGKEIANHGKTLVAGNRSLKVEQCSLIGDHNYLNLAVVYEIAGLYGITDEQFLHAASTFQTLKHRLEDLGTFGGIRFVDDSISTIGQSCIQAITSLKDVDTVLVGGMDRGIEYDELEDYFHTHPNIQVIFMYASGKRVYDEMKQKNLLRKGLYVTQDLAEAVQQAKQLTAKGHICLLSPAASSYDHFRNFEERGEVFERLAKGDEE